MNQPERARVTADDLSGIPSAGTLHRCEHAGCERPGIGVYLAGGTSEPDAWYCIEHMTDDGYCWGCLYFQAGTEAFDFSETGLCGECQQNADVTGEDPYDEEDTDGWFYEDEDELPF